jgi:hypothetical protein
MNNNRQIGRAGEFLAAYILEQHNIRCTHVDIDRDDLWGVTASKTFHRIQVKAASKPIIHAKHHKSPKYSFVTNGLVGYRGIVIFAALDLGLILCTLGSEIKSQSHKVKPELFTVEAQTESIKRCFV